MKTSTWIACIFASSFAFLADAHSDDTGIAAATLGLDAKTQTDGGSVKTASVAETRSTAAAASNGSQKASCAVGYIGTPKLFEKNEDFMNLMKNLIAASLMNGCDFLAGEPNWKELHENFTKHNKDDDAFGVDKVKDMKKEDTSKFTIIIVAPGGDGTKDEAKRFFEANLVMGTLINSEDKDHGHKDFQDKLNSVAQLDLAAKPGWDEADKFIKDLKSAIAKSGTETLKPMLVIALTFYTLLTLVL